MDKAEPCRFYAFLFELRDLRFAPGLQKSINGYALRFHLIRHKGDYVGQFGVGLLIFLVMLRRNKARIVAEITRRNLVDLERRPRFA
ncbi:MAG: hypothetical protein L0Y58_10025, partial [Verrucomicrobia subdivision 3 bacterium]|nr:hypothetical protein [Limisphaerales bacterium]